MKKLKDISRESRDIEYSQSLSLSDLLRVLVNDYTYAKVESEKLIKAAENNPEILAQFHNLVRSSLSQFESLLGTASSRIYHPLKQAVCSGESYISLAEFQCFMNDVHSLIKEFSSQNRLDIQGWIYFTDNILHHNEEQIKFDLNSKQTFLLRVLFNSPLCREMMVVDVADDMARLDGEQDDIKGKMENSIKRAAEEINMKFTMISESSSKLIIRDSRSIKLNKETFHPILLI